MFVFALLLSLLQCHVHCQSPACICTHTSNLLSRAHTHVHTPLNTQAHGDVWFSFSFAAFDVIVIMFLSSVDCVGVVWCPAYYSLFGCGVFAQDGCTPAMNAADEGNADCLKVLVDANADVNLQDKVSACMCAGRVRSPVPQHL